MKKFSFLLILSCILCMSIFTETKAQSPTPRVGTEWTKVAFYNQDINSVIAKDTVEFYPDQNVSKVLVQADYSGMAGDSCQVKIFPSMNKAKFKSTPSNTLANLRWKNGEGANVTKFDYIDVTNIPCNYIYSLTDTLTKMTTGTVTLTFKPVFK